MVTLPTDEISNHKSLFNRYLKYKRYHQSWQSFPSWRWWPSTSSTFRLGSWVLKQYLALRRPDHGLVATKQYNKDIAPMDDKFDGHTNNLAVFLASVPDRSQRFNWQTLMTIPLADGTTRNMLMHYGQVTIDNVCAHATTIVGTHTRDTQDNDKFYDFRVDSLTLSFLLLPSIWSTRLPHYLNKQSYSPGSTIQLLPNMFVKC